METTQNLKCLLKKIEELSGLWEYPDEIARVEVSLTTFNLYNL